ncbi:MAG: DegT/DnrJ/EryC1/StrS family aminotransferase, partial [Elusimicrobiota bacterium]
MKKTLTRKHTDTPQNRRIIPLVHPVLGKEEKNIVAKIIDSGIIASGSYVETFETQFARYCGAAHGIAVSNGTTALHAALLACSVKPGDKVLTTPFSFIATANSILHCGAIPVFADIDPATYNLSPADAERVLRREKNIKAIMVVHLYGLPADMDAFTKLSKKHGCALIEDCAQAHGAQWRKRTVGSIGDAAAFSFYATKNATTGEGGVVLTNDNAIAARVRQIINHGRDGHATHTILGFNYRLTNIAAGIGIAQIKQLPRWTQKRRANARFLTNQLKGISTLITPVEPPNTTPAYHQYTVRVPAGVRDAFMTHLHSRGIGCGVYYATPIHQQPLYAGLGYKAGICPVAEQAAREVVSLPVHPLLTARDLRAIV